MVGKSAPKAIDQDLVIRSFDYDPDRGVLIWKYRDWVAPQVNTRWAGKDAGGYDDDGYIVVGWQGLLVFAHRLIWVWHFGDTAKAGIDHRDCIKDNNRIQNLRPASQGQNRCNTRAMARNKTGVKGVIYYPSKGKYIAQICKNYKRYHLGTFDNLEDAAATYAKAAGDFHGTFSRSI